MTPRGRPRATRSPTCCCISCASPTRWDIDPLTEAQRKLAENERKYPVDKARGTAKKYTEL